MILTDEQLLALQIKLGWDVSAQDRASIALDSDDEGDGETSDAAPESP